MTQINTHLLSIIDFSFFSKCPLLKCQNIETFASIALIACVILKVSEIVTICTAKLLKITPQYGQFRKTGHTQMMKPEQ